MRKYIVACTLIYLVVSVYILSASAFGITAIKAPASDNIRLSCRVAEGMIQVGRFGRWETMYIKGVNIGAGMPGAFPGEFAVSKKLYLEWFRQIAAMNANTIRVYTIMGPDFYDALYQYNTRHLKPLFLIQGVWVDEEAMLETGDAFSPRILGVFKQDVIDAIDVIHGQAVLEQPSASKSDGRFARDVSKWTIGYILGIEWDGAFIQSTNARNPGATYYHGSYLKTAGAAPFESFLAEVGDYAISYESRAYGQQRPVAFANWPVTDPIEHTNEEPSVNLGQLDVEHIRSTDSFFAGQFASYHAYPYYPDFLSMQPEYRLPGTDGRIDPYRAYLEALKSHHRMPVLISEYGIPSSRGVARIEPFNGYNQGNVSETRQGTLLAELTRTIHATGFAGGLIFSWQDEWFKRTWNTMDFNLPDARANWPDWQTNEQSFGLLAFDPGWKRTVSTTDGMTSEWREDDLVCESDDVQLYAMSDEKFLYLRIRKPALSFGTDRFLLPIDVTDRSGIRRSDHFNASFEHPADFLVVVEGKQDSALFVHDYYDVFRYRYSQALFRTDPGSHGFLPDSGDFTESFLALRAPLPIGDTGAFTEPLYFNTGRLTYGQADPDAPDYDSLADFCRSGDDIELRIPWALLNIMDPSSRSVMDDFYSQGAISPVIADQIRIGIGMADAHAPIRMAPYSWPMWEDPSWHPRLKPSYDVVRDAFKSIGKEGA